MIENYKNRIKSYENSYFENKVSSNLFEKKKTRKNNSMKIKNSSKDNMSRR